MKVKQTQNELIIWETPGCLWFFGLFFAIVGGIFVYGALGGFTNWDEVSFWQLMLAFSMGAIAISVGIWTIYNAQISKVVIDRIEDKVLIKRFGLFGKRESIYKFSEIKEFCLIEEKDNEGSSVWSFGIKLNSGDTVKVNSMPSYFEEYRRRYIFEVNNFMRKQITSYHTDSLE